MGRRWRITVVLGGMGLIGLWVLLHRLAPTAYADLLTAWGVVPFRFPFVDAHSVLSALVCTQRGFDTYVLNPCDALTRAFVYSPLMLEAAIFPVSMDWNNWVGLILALLFPLSVAALPAPNGRREWAVMLLAMLSTMSMFALERGNVDLLFFALLVGAGHLLMRAGPAPRYVAYALILFSGFLKYYPIVALALALRERPRRFLIITAGAIIVSALFIVHYRVGLSEAMGRVPNGSYFTDLFGAKNLPGGLTELLSPIGSWPIGASILAVFPWLLLAALLWGFGVAAVGGQADSDTLMRLSESERLFLAMGAVLVVGCFFAGQSIGYRGILFLLLLPGLLALARRPDGKRFGIVTWLIVFLMWGEMFRQGLAHLSFGNAMADNLLQVVRVAFWLVRELIWWRVVGTLGGVIVAFAMTSDMGVWARAQLRGWRARDPVSPFIDRRAQ